MRTRLMIPTLALLFASAGLATAQQETQASRPLGTLDVGFRASGVDGDAARFQRYQDIRGTGAAVNFAVAREGPQWAVKAAGRNVGYLDQQFALAAATRRFRVSFDWNQTPLFYGNSPATAYVQASPGVFSLDPAARLAVQNATAVGIPLTSAQTSIYRGLSHPFDLRSRRDNFRLEAAYQATRELTVKLGLDSYARTGAQPWSAGFALSVLPEVPLPLDNRTTTLTAGGEWANGKGMLRLGYQGSFFSNNVETLTLDNPVRATDYSQDPRTVTGYDPSGYVTGYGAAAGRMALSPANHANGINGLGLIKLPSHSSLSGAFAVVGMNQDAALIPWTSNPVIADPKVYALFPGLAQLPRPTAQADVRQTNATVNFNSHATPYFGLTARYRYFNRADRTPIFDATEYVRVDAVPERTGGVTEHLDMTRNTVDVDATFNLIPYTAVGVGVGHDVLDQVLAYSRLGDTTLRASVDTIGNRYVTLRALYERTRRAGSGFDGDVLTGASAQPASRAYDDASRTRYRTTGLVDIAPFAGVGVNVSFFRGSDTYDDPNQQFGLLDNDNTGYNVGVSVVPSQKVSLGANYGRERYRSLQRSRAASSPSDPSWLDPNRNWDLDNDEKVNTLGLYVDLIKAMPKMDVRFGYDRSDSNQGFVHSGPRIDALAAIGQFIPLPSVTNTWQRATVDVRYFLSANVGVGAGYWYDRYDVSDFQTLDLSNGTPRTDYIGGLMLGYGYRPFNANTGFLRVFYAF